MLAWKKVVLQCSDPGSTNPGSTAPYLFCWEQDGAATSFYLTNTVQLFYETLTSEQFSFKLNRLNAELEGVVDQGSYVKLTQFIWTKGYGEHPLSGRFIF